MLSDDGSIWITLDDNEVHYLKVMCDEIFGRNNFVSSITWFKRISPANDAKFFSSDHDNIIVFAKRKDIWVPNRLARTEKQNANYRNPAEYTTKNHCERLERKNLRLTKHRHIAKKSRSERTSGE